MEKFELALESAAIAGSGNRVKERMLSPSLKCVTFTAPALYAAREIGRDALYHTLVTTEEPLSGERMGEEIKRGVRISVKDLVKRRAKRVLAVGLGNPAAVVDALGAETVGRLSAGERGGSYLARIVPSVFGMTGLESASVVRGVCSEYRPDLILSVDTLSTRRAERLYRAVQITNGGVVPGGGVGNRREPISEESLGIPVISIGVPLLAAADRCSSLPAGLVVTPKEIDLLVPFYAEALAEGIESALFE